MSTTPSILQLNQSDLRYLLNMIKNEVKRELNCHAIGTIITFDPITATCTVAFNYKKTLKQRNATSENTYTDVIIDYPVLVRVPVIVLGGGGGYTTYPIFAGDTCLLMFCDRDIDLWLEQGSTSSPPNSERLHDLSDAVALVGLNSVATPILNYAIDGIVTAIGQTIAKFTSLFASIIDSTGQRLPQSGFGQPYFGITLPSGWLWCYGQSVLITSYPALFAAIGYVYGGSGLFFNLPDMRGRVPVGLNNIGGVDGGPLTPVYTPLRDVLGGKVGEEAHQLSILEMPSHTHPFPSWDYVKGFSGNSTTSPRDPQTGTTYPAGGDVPHNNVQPGLMVNWIIKI